MGCAAQTCRRRRIQMRNDKRYSAPRKDAQASARKYAAKLAAALERAQKRKKPSSR
jgi:hypothetical protein